jgi:hypothetical protein
MTNDPRRLVMDGYESSESFYEREKKDRLVGLTYVIKHEDKMSSNFSHYIENGKSRRKFL